MNFEASEDLRAFLSAVERLVERHASEATSPATRFHYCKPLERELEASGFLDCMQIEELGRIGAAAMIMELSRAPQCMETAASSLIGPTVCPEMPRPIALLWDGLDRPARFLPVARTVVAVHGETVQIAALEEGDVKTVESTFAYPMGVLADAARLDWRVIPEADPASLRDLWRIGVAAEIVGCLDAGLKSVVEYAKDRRQFGRPLGSFQAIQHRLAECAALVESARWLSLRAADSASAADISMATGLAQHIANRVAYDLHQFMGAMGLTLEHPLHRWTYRSKLLRSELGGAEHHFALAADATWGSTSSSERLQ